MGLDERKISGEVLDSVHEVIDENLSNLVEGIGEVGTSREVSKDSGSNKELNETPEEVKTEGMKLEAKADESGLSLVSMKAPKGVCETDKDSCVIDMKCSSHKGFYEVSQGEKICRICHLTFGQSSDATSVENGSATSGDFIQLGCSCKDELGIAHIHCAEVWFKLKENRLCEICGETAKNVSVAANNGFMEEWNDR
ncbi:RING/FYVE/PHD zinc finger superfamily protein [Trifolium repens]|nr:RING/FYVE/PHD zinc finger superfamily protein [Trifolium repens]